MRVLGLDIGGAHVKSALYVKGSGRALPKRKISPLEIYKNPERLTPVLRRLRKQERPGAVALTMTGELVDIFSSRRQGVRWIIDVVEEAMRPLEVKVMDVCGELVSAAKARREWEKIASANWAATAQWIARNLDSCVVVDIGSTTVDILPVTKRRPAVHGENDLERLKSGELLYTGYLRTNAAFVLPEIDIEGKKVGVCPEHFAIMGDVHLLLGDIKPEDYTAPAPDGRGKTKKAAARRLARIVLSDVETLGMEGVESIASQIKMAQTRKIAAAVKKVVVENRLAEAPIALIGPGRIYRNDLEKKVGSVFLDRAGDSPVERIDPAACAAALF